MERATGNGRAATMGENASSNQRAKRSPWYQDQAMPATLASDRVPMAARDTSSRRGLAEMPAAAAAASAETARAQNRPNAQAVVGAQRHRQRDKHHERRQASTGSTYSAASFHTGSLG